LAEDAEQAQVKGQVVKEVEQSVKEDDGVNGPLAYRLCCPRMLLDHFRYVYKIPLASAWDVFGIQSHAQSRPLARDKVQKIKAMAPAKYESA
jgi:hypothetical protein